MGILFFSAVVSVVTLPLVVYVVISMANTIMSDYKDRMHDCLLLYVVAVLIVAMVACVTHIASISQDYNFYSYSAILHLTYSTGWVL